MKTCQDFESLLSLFSNGELGAEPRAAVAAHLAACAACRQKIEGYDEIRKYLSHLPTPALPENLFVDFHQGVLEKIAHRDKMQQQSFGLVAVLYALYRRQRYIIAVVALIMLIAVPAWLTHALRTISPPQLNLAQLLEKRDWTGLYYAMCNREVRVTLLNEPVPVRLLHAALHELLEAQRQNPKVRLGLQQVLAKLKTHEGNSFGLSRSVQILGQINAAGYEPATRPRRITWNAESTLLALQQLGENKTMTIRELFFQTTFERNP